MKIVVLGAGNVGRAVVQALYEEHDVTVIDLDGRRLAMMSELYDVRTVEGNGTTRDVLRDAGVKDAQLLLACSSREEANLVCAMLVKRLSSALAIVRTTSAEYLEAWREQEIDVDFMVSSELETANSISGIVGIPAARQTDVFAEGQVQIVEFDVPEGAPDGAGDRAAAARGEHPAGLQGRRRDPRRRPDQAARHGARPARRSRRHHRLTGPGEAWSGLIAHGEREIEDIVIFGAGRIGATIATVLLERDLRVRLVEADGRAGPPRRRDAAKRRACSTPMRAAGTSFSASASARPPPPCSR